ncbi:MAG: tRNA (adenosine(37)-N6)-threonylcarbamoyltransferase complex dimerization subunit type 1 TsaB [Methylococcales bacterium]|nr:tRNA (adenosine(37)-N6)-threonylcarbamoyltransferase complex dimerization subunit type 1 TsaB [Methylococcales bacterium]
MKILAIDTSSEGCSVALSSDDHIVEQFEIAPRRHTKLVIPMMEAVLAEAECALSDLDMLAFACGPGSFTGLRVAASVAQGVALGADLPIVPVSTLAALAKQAQRLNLSDHVVVANDARMAQVYWAEYQVQQGEMVCLSGEHVSTPSVELLSQVSTRHCVGNGWQVYEEAFSGFENQVYTECIHVHAQDVCALAVKQFSQGGDWSHELAVPVYVRDQVVRVPTPKNV